MTDANENPGIFFFTLPRAFANEIAIGRALSDVFKHAVEAEPVGDTDEYELTGLSLDTATLVHRHAHMLRQAEGIESVSFRATSGGRLNHLLADKPRDTAPDLD